jgi:hypothetical protein
LFFQDTNGLIFHALPAFLGVSVSQQFAVNSLTVARKPGEAVGGICALRRDNGDCLTINVEYNQLDPLLRATVSPAGDVPDASGFSPYPGNINVLLFSLDTYAKTLQRTAGAVPEFINPKYQDKEKTVFTPTRLECMMQDFPKLLGAHDRVGFTQMDRWLCFSAVKNNVVDARKKAKDTGFGECASSGEADMYAVHRLKLELCGVRIDQPSETKVHFWVAPRLTVGFARCDIVLFVCSELCRNSVERRSARGVVSVVRVFAGRIEREARRRVVDSSVCEIDADCRRSRRSLQPCRRRWRVGGSGW